MSAGQRATQSQLLCNHLRLWLTGLQRSHVVIAAFWPLKDEPDITPVLFELHRAGHVVVLPIVVTRHAALEFHPWSPEQPMQVGNFGVMEPTRTQALLPDVLLIPTLGFTEHGDRLGYGGGYYDRTLDVLQQYRKPVAIGIAWSEALLTRTQPGYLPQTHDMPLQAIVTAEGWLPVMPSLNE